MLVLPVQAVGKSNEHLAFPGTLTLSAETLIRAWTEIGESVHRAGCRKLVIVNSHGGNVPVIDIVARELRVRLGMLAVVTAWHRLGYPDGLFAPDELRHGIHGGEAETSLMLAFRPATVRMDAGGELRAAHGGDGGRLPLARRRPARRLRLDEPGPPPRRRHGERRLRDAGEGRGRRGSRARGCSSSSCARSTASRLE